MSKWSLIAVAGFLVSAVIADTYQMRQGNCDNIVGDEIGQSRVFEEKEFANRSYCMIECDSLPGCLSFEFDLFEFRCRYYNAHNTRADNYFLTECWDREVPADRYSYDWRQDQCPDFFQGDIIKDWNDKPREWCMLQCEQDFSCLSFEWKKTTGSCTLRDDNFQTNTESVEDTGCFNKLIKPQEDEQTDSSTEQVQQYWFINKYGYDTQLIWILYLTTIILSMTYVFSLPLMSIPMFTLMVYFFYEPIQIIVSENQKVLFTTSDFFIDVFLILFGGMLAVYLGLVLCWVVTLVPFYSFAIELISTGTISSNQDWNTFAQYVLTAWISQVFFATIAGALGSFLFLNWGDPVTEVEDA